MSSIVGKTWTLNVQGELIDVTSEYPTPDENWRFVDKYGHEHRYERGYPTLNLVVDRQHFCDGSEGLYNHDPHMAIDESHYECATCREVIVPAQHPSHSPRVITGMLSATLTGSTELSGETIKMELTPDEFDQFAAASEADRDRLARRLLTDAPTERVLQRSYLSY